MGRILNINHKKELLRSLWVGLRVLRVAWLFKIQASTVAVWELSALISLKDSGEV